MSSDPTRLFEANSEAPDVLRGLLQEARNVGPSAAQTARLAAKLGPAFGAVAGGSAFASLSGGVMLAEWRSDDGGWTSAQSEAVTWSP